MATHDPLEGLGQSAWLSAVFGGARYMAADLQSFPTSSFTLSFWFRAKQDGTVVFLGEHDTGSTVNAEQTSMAVSVAAGGIEVRFANWADVIMKPSVNLVDGSDHYIAITFQQSSKLPVPGTASVTIQVDGIQKQTSSAVLNNQSGKISLVGTPLYLATFPPDRSRDNPIRLSEGFTGRLMDLRIWSRILTDEEIATDQWSTVFGDEPDLYLAMPLDEDSVDRATESVLDLSPAHRNAATPIILDDMSYLYFDGSMAKFPVNSRTAEMWVRCGTNTGGSDLISYANVANSDHPNQGGAEWNVALGDFGSGITDGEWHHLAVVVDAAANTESFYVDGVKTSSRPRRAPGQIAGQPFLIGAWQATDANDRMFGGLIRDFYLWSTTRTDAQIWDSAGGNLPTADGTLVLNALPSPVATVPDDPSAAFTHKQSLTLTSAQSAQGNVPSSDPDYAVDIDDYTIVAMIRMRKPGVVLTRMERGPDGWHGFSFSATPVGGILIQEWAGAVGRNTGYAPTPTEVSLLDGYRHSIAFRRADDGCMLFVDGQPVRILQSGSLAHVDVNSMARVQVGGVDPSSPNPGDPKSFEGDLFLLAYWNLALSQADIHKAAFGLMEGLYTGMLGYWTFDGTLEDQSYAGDDLTMTTAGQFIPSVRTMWSHSPSSAYRFHHVEGISGEVRNGKRDVGLEHVVDVPAGAAMMFAGLTGRDDQLAPPATVVLSITAPNGQIYNTDANTGQLFLKNGPVGVVAFVIQSPAAGKWKFGLTAKAQDDFVFQAHVLPAQGAANDLRHAMDALFRSGGVQPASNRRQRGPSGLTIATMVGTAVLAGVLAVAVGTGVVTGGWVILFCMAALGVGRMAAETLFSVLDQRNRLNAANQTAATVLPPLAGLAPISGTGLQIIDNLKFPKPTGAATRSSLDFAIPAGTTAFSFHVWYDPANVTSTTGDKSLKLTGPGPQNLVVPDSGQPFLYTETVAMEYAGLLPGYASISVPVNQAQAGNLSGQWTATVGGLDSMDPSTFQVRLCIRTAPTNAPVTTGYGVPVNFFYVGNQWYRGTYKDLLVDVQAFLNKAIYSQADMHLQFSPVMHLPGGQFSADLYDTATKALIANNAAASAINVFLFEKMTIPIKGQGNAGGFSPIVGPQGFGSPYSCVFILVGESDKSNELLNALGVRIGHEMGHYLGLVHESSCLDNEGFRMNPDKAAALSQCRAVLKERGKTKSITKLTIDGNLMYSHNPGTRLNPTQVFVIQHAPILEPLTGP